MPNIDYFLIFENIFIFSLELLSGTSLKDLWTFGTVIASTKVSIRPFFNTCLTRDPPGNAARKVSYSILCIAGSMTARRFAFCNTFTLP